MAFSLNEIPQADRLEKLVSVVEAVNNGAKKDTEIAEAATLSDQQLSYYLDSAMLLKLIAREEGEIAVSATGKDLANANYQEKKEILKNALNDNRLFKTIIIFIERSKDGIYRQQIQDFLITITENGAHNFVPRRIQTIIAWLEYLDIIAEIDERYVYNTNQSPDLDTKLPEESIYPANYSQEVDIKEERFSVFELLRKIAQDKILMNPDFQRNLVWRQYQKSQFIESLVLNVPLPPLYFKRELDGKYIIVDGLQRTSTLKSYLSNEINEKFSLDGLEALPRLNGKFFEDLEDDIKTRIEDKSLLVYVLQPNVPMLVVYDIFNRINTGGTQLERQEIRNCIFIGKSTTLLKGLSESNEFRKAIDFGISPTRMKDREAILRCLAFTILDYKKEFNNSMDDFLERAMKKINRMSDNEVAHLGKSFFRVMLLTRDFFGNKNFRLPTDYSRGRINIAIMESVFYFFWHSSDSFLNEHMNQITHNYFQNLLTDRDYLESVKFSTGSTSKVIVRFNKAEEILGNI